MPLPLLALLVDPPTGYFEAPAGRRYAVVAPGGTTILPNGRFLTPLGRRLYTGEDLWGLAVSPDGATVIGLSDGGMTVYRGVEKRWIASKEIAPTAVFSSDGRSLVISTGEAGGIRVLDTATWTVQSQISSNAAGTTDSYINDLVLDRTGRYAYGVDVANQQLVTFDLESKQVVSRAKAGRQPYALALGRDGRSLFVANIGIFDYSVVPPPKDGSGNKRGLMRPPFSFPGPHYRDGLEMEGRKVPGLGSELVPDAQSVWQYSVMSPAKPVFAKAAKAGLLIHAPADGGKAAGGSAPNKVLVHGGKLYVSNANNDTVQVFDERNLKLLKALKLSPSPAVKMLRGVIPSGLAINRAGTRLYVCESGLNSVAIIDLTRRLTVGRIPTGWFPMQVALAPDEKSLYIASQKGLGRGPRGPLGARRPGDERYGMPEMPGMIDHVRLPNAATLKTWSRQVLENNGLIAKPPPNSARVFPVRPGKASPNIQHVVFITKENHTFDGIFGGLAGAKGEPDYAEFGMTGWIKEKGKDTRLPIMPNHIRLAEQFAINDNFYMEPQASGDGHRWLVGVYPSLWTTRVFYAGWNFRANDKAKGRLVSFGSNGSQIPEDYLENGSLWEHLSRGGIPFRNYGEGFEFPGVDEGLPFSKTGAGEVVNFPMSKVLFDNTCFEFPIYNTNIPDIARADWFIEDIENNYRKKRKPLPRFINIAICNDHGDKPKPERGYPYVCSYMADNDLALGRIVEYLTRQPEWKKMAIFVTQDDSGADNDHLDRHRSFVLAISPYAKRRYVSHDHTSIMSIIRSIYLLFGLGPNNMFDAVATPLHDMFTDKPDFTPYTHVPANPVVFKPEETFDPSDPKFERRRAQRSVPMDDPKFFDWLRNRGGG